MEPLDRIEHLLLQRHPDARVSEQDVADAIWDVFREGLPEDDRQVLDQSEGYTASRRRIILELVAEPVIRRLVKSGKFDRRED